MAATVSLSQSTENQSAMYEQHTSSDQQQQCLILYDDSSRSQNGVGVIGLGKQILMALIFYGFSSATEFESLFAIVRMFRLIKDERNQLIGMISKGLWYLMFLGILIISHVGSISMQYFGLPVYLVSLPGLMSGTISIFLIPFLGRISDKGPNPMRRKLVIQAISTVCFMLAFVILAACTWVKILEQEIKMNNSTSVPNNGDPLSGTGELVNVTRATILNSKSEPSTVTSSVPITGIFSMMVVLLIDIGYDMSMSMTRASLLQAVPHKLANRILSTASLMTSLAGLTMCVIGMINFPRILEPILGIDGYGATLLLLSFTVGLVIFITSITSIRMTSKIYKNKTRIKEVEKQPLLHDRNGLDEGENISEETSFRNCIKSKNKKHYKATDENNTSVLYPSSSFSVDKTSETLFPSNYQQIPLSDTENHFNLRPRDYHAQRERHAKSEEIKCQGLTEKNKSFSLLSSTEEESEHKRFKPSEEDKIDCLNLKRFLNHQQHQKENYFWHRRFVVSLFTSFFCFAAVNAVTVYQTNTLTLELFKGDPLALPGTPGRIRYEQGILTSSFGLLAAYILFILSSLVSVKLIDRIGAVRLMVFSNLFHAALLTVYSLLPNIKTYIGMMLAYGLNKSACYTLPFVLGKSYMNPSKDKDDDPTPTGKSSSNSIGQMTSWVGITIPLSYVLLSAFMGPLMDATGSAWPPMYFAIFAGVLSGITGILLSFL